MQAKNSGAESDSGHPGVGLDPAILAFQPVANLFLLAANRDGRYSTAAALIHSDPEVFLSDYCTSEL